MGVGRSLEKIAAALSGQYRLTYGTLPEIEEAQDRGQGRASRRQGLARRVPAASDPAKHAPTRRAPSSLVLLAVRSGPGPGAAAPAPPTFEVGIEVINLNVSVTDGRATAT